MAYAEPSPEGPGRGRFEITSGTTPLHRICDGTSQWTYYQEREQYVKAMLPQITPCVFPINSWRNIGVILPSAVLAGTDRVTVDGRLRECQVVRSGSEVTANRSIRVSKEICVDPVSHLILRQQWEESTPDPRIVTMTFSSIRFNTKLDPELFQFRPQKRVWKSL